MIATKNQLDELMMICKLSGAKVWVYDEGRRIDIYLDENPRSIQDWMIKHRINSVEYESFNYQQNKYTIILTEK